MSLQTFFDNFALLADAPNGVAKLKTLLINLAMRGALRVDSSDLQSSDAEHYKSITASTSTNEPYALPSHWQWCLLDEVVEILDYKREPVSEEERNLRIAGKSQEELYPYYGATQQTGWIDSYIFDEELVLLGEDGVPFFDLDRPKAYLVSGKCWVNNHAHVLRGVRVDNRFLLRYLNIYDYSERITGTTRLKLNQARMRTIPIPLPPIEEQKRIVAKVDELLRLCDELEARQQQRRASRVRLNQATLAPLNNAAALAPEEFEQAAVRLADNFAALYDSAETVSRLRSTILQLAVQGKLVPQDPNDEPASDLLKGMRKERDRLIKGKKIRQDKPLPPLSENEVLFALPDKWEWARLDSLCYLITDGTHYTPTYIPSGVPFLSVKDVTGGKIDFSNTRFISPEEHEELSKRCKPEFQDILFTKVGTTGIAKVVDVETEFSIFVSLALLKFSKDYLSPYFLELLLNSPLVKAQSERDTQGVGNKNLVLKYIKSFAVPLPPLAEQKRIVAKVNQLMTLCDELETKLRRTEADSEKLMKATVRDLLATVNEPLLEESLSVIA